MQERVAQFARELHRLRPEGGKLGLAVSGGPDSLAMLLLAEAAVPGEFEVATVDHGLRPANADECAMVAQACSERGIRCELLSVKVGAGNVQAQARRARYGALLDWADRRGIAAVATAHHMSDQAETVLMRLNRGSGVGGLAGIREQCRFEGRVAVVIRPLLHVRREALAEVVAGSGLVPVQDPSNVDDRYDRARIRKALAESEWLKPDELSISAVLLADAEDAIEWSVQREWAEQIAQSADEVRYRGMAGVVGPLRPVPREIVMRVIERILDGFDGHAYRSAIAGLIDRLDAGEGGNLAGVLATVQGGDWVFRREPPRRTG